MGLPVRYEPKNLDAVRENMEDFAIFREARWIKYFQRINGFHEEMTFQFSMNFTRDHPIIKGLRIDVSEQALVEVTGFPRIGNTWFCQINTT